MEFDEQQLEALKQPHPPVVDGIAARIVDETVQINPAQSDTSTVLGEIQREHPEIEARPYQLACLDVLARARDDGRKKALVHMATGLGKTTIAGVDVKRFTQEHPGARTLFLCHRNYILNQARQRFQVILGEEHTSGKLTAKSRDAHEVSTLFSSLQMMANRRHDFDPEEFDYVVVDEGHHGKATTYEPTLEYFQPKFLLGLTATPDRGDLQDIRDIFGHEVFSKTLAEALAEGLLAQPDYRVIMDDIDEEVLRGLLMEEGLTISDINKRVFLPRRDEEIVRIVQDRIREKGIQNPRIIGFCASIEHAERISDLLPKSRPLHSKIKGKGVKQQLFDEFHAGELEGMVTVDMFNEGVDVPDANVILFLRNTNSETIFLQQLGRGLRKTEDKDEVLVLDFAGNCDRLLMVEKLLYDATRNTRTVRHKESELYDPDDIDLYSLDFKDIEEAAELVRELDLGSFEFTETTRKIMEIIKKVHSRTALYKEWSGEDSISYYKKLSEALGRPATPMDIQAASRDQQGPSLTLLARDFSGKVVDLRKAAGFDEELRRFWPNWTADDSVKYYKELSASLGRPATTADIGQASQDGLGPSHATVLMPFGRSIQKLKAEAGFVPRGKGVEWSPSDSVKYYRELSEELGRPAVDKDIRGMSKSGKGPSPTLLLRDFEGKISKLRVASELDAPDSRLWSEERFISYYQTLSEGLGRPAEVSDINEAFRNGKGPGFMSFYTRFGSINVLRERSGIEVRKPYSEWSAEEFAEYYTDLCSSLGRTATQKDLDAASKQHQGPSARTITRYFGPLDKLKETTEES